MQPDTHQQQTNTPETSRGKSPSMLLLLRPSVLLAVAVAVGLPGGSWASTVLTQQEGRGCSADYAVVESGETYILLNKEKVSHLDASFNFFMQTDSSVGGITVSVTGTDGKEYSAWFPAGYVEECFSHEGFWDHVLSFVKIRNHTSTLKLGFETGWCVKMCETDKSPSGLLSHSVMVHGASRWRFTYPPEPCHTVPLGPIPMPPTLPSCLNPPPAPMSGLVVTTITIKTLLVAVLAVAVVVAVVVFKKNSSLPADASQPALCE